MQRERISWKKKEIGKEKESKLMQKKGTRENYETKQEKTSVW